MATISIPQPPPLPTDGGADLIAWAERTRDDHPAFPDASGSVWYVLTYDGVRRLLTEHATFSSDLTEVGAVEIFQTANMLRMDPPQHGKYRKLVNRAFTPGKIAALEPRIAEVGGELLDAADRSDDLDIVDALSYPLPVTVIAELLGVPTDDRGLFKSWVDNMFNRTIDNPFDPNIKEALIAAVAPLQDYLCDHVRRRRDAPREDLLSDLIRAEVDGERFTDEEAATFAGVLLLAGHVTTTLLVGNAVRSLSENPDVADQLRATPDRLASAIEEMLRVRPPVGAIARMTKTDTVLEGVEIPAGRLVLGSIVAANHDPRAFPEPRSFRTDRFDRDSSSTPHLAFGHGVHFCVGMQLAKLEGRVILDMMLRRYSTIRVDESRPAEYYANQRFNGPKSLPVVLRP